jgi:hypothetical protein
LGILSDYITNPSFGPQELETERKHQLRRIGAIRGRATIAYAARLTPIPGLALPVDLNFGDLLPFHELLSELAGDDIDVILETPGGDGVVARDMVELLHERFKRQVAFVIPGWAKSAGTIMAMGGHEILMGPTSALGPIDAQLQFEGKRFSADALLEGMQQIQEDVKKHGLSPALIPMLQRISPGDLQNAKNAMDFARVTVTEWLCKYKFATWTHHRTHSPGTEVTPEEREERARTIARDLSNHSRWKTHGRSLRLPDLIAMGLEITDYSKDPDLNDAIQRYYVLQRMTLDAGNAFKLIETPDRQVIQRFAHPMQPSDARPAPIAPQSSLTAEVGCKACGTQWKVQLNVAPGTPLAAGAVAYPQGDKLTCRCGAVLDLTAIREQVEVACGRPVIPG